MNIVICGAGEVGSHAAEVLARSGANITVIDSNAARLRAIEDTMDVATVCGNCAQADVLLQAGTHGTDLVLAATSSDEVNMLAASIGKKLGAGRNLGGTCRRSPTQLRDTHRNEGTSTARH